MSHEDADAEQDTRCRDELGHSSPPSQGANRAVVRFRMTSSNQENGFVGLPPYPFTARRPRWGSPAVAPIDRHIDSPPKPDSRAAFLESGFRYSAVFGSDKRDHENHYRCFYIGV